MLEYKYVIVDQSMPNAVSSKWENFYGNRKVLLSQLLSYESGKKDQGNIIKVRDTFNKHEE